jgi:hypothetical protein
MVKDKVYLPEDDTPVDLSKYAGLTEEELEILYEKAMEEAYGK